MYSAALVRKWRYALDDIIQQNEVLHTRQQQERDLCLQLADIEYRLNGVSGIDVSRVRLENGTGIDRIRLLEKKDKIEEQLAQHRSYTKALTARTTKIKQALHDGLSPDEYSKVSGYLDGSKRYGEIEDIIERFADKRERFI